MRSVFSNREAAHVWASRTQCGRSSNGSIFFDRASIYSYGSHFRMAQFVTNEAGEVACLINPDSYSITTAKHQSLVRQALPSYVLRLTAPQAERNDAAVLKFHTDAAEVAWRKAARARVHGPAFIVRAQEHVEEFNRYAAFFGIAERMAMPDNVEAAMLQARERAAAEAKRNAAERAAREVEREAARVRRAADDAVQMARWLDGAPIHAPYTDETRLRINGDDIETSRGASVPVAVAPMLWDRINSSRLAGVDVDYTPHTVRIGPYELRTIRANGDVQIGCHHLTYAELARIAGLLGLAVPAVAVA